MALPTRYGSAFLVGTTGQTFAAGYDIDNSGVVDGGTIIKAGNKEATSPVTNDLSINTLADNVGDRAVGSKIVANVGTGASTTDRAGLQSSQSGLSPQGLRLHSMLVLHNGLLEVFLIPLVELLTQLSDTLVVLLVMVDTTIFTELLLIV